MTSSPMGRTQCPLPVVRVDDWLIWPGGFSRPMTRWERLKWRLHLRRLSQ